MCSITWRIVHSLLRWEGGTLTNDIDGRGGILARQLIQVSTECFSQCHHVVDALTDGKATKGQ